MARLIGIFMDAAVEFGRRAERQTPEKSSGSKKSDKSTRSRGASHWTRVSVRLTKLATLISILEFYSALLR
jgi:hypothetical protein